jgi:hypothetical protein
MDAGLTVMPIWTGSCHCGAVRFRIEAEIVDLYRCDCSLCRMKGALMTSVHKDQFTLLEGGSVLSEYNWNTKVARHFFCSVCGIYPFHRKRAMPDHYGINVHCLGGFDPAGIAVRQAEGKGMTVAPDGRGAIWTGPRTS